MPCWHIPECLFQVTHAVNVRGCATHNCCPPPQCSAPDLQILLSVDTCQLVCPGISSRHVGMLFWTKPLPQTHTQLTSFPFSDMLHCALMWLVSFTASTDPRRCGPGCSTWRHQTAPSCTAQACSRAKPGGRCRAACLPACPPARLPACPPACLPACLLACLPAPLQTH